MNSLSLMNADCVDNFKIKDMGVGLSKDTKVQLKRRLQSLELRAPALSFTKLTYFKTAEGIKGILKINTPGKIFRSVSVGNCPFSVYNQLENKINIQLLSWKKLRFLTNYLPKEYGQSQRKLTGGHR